MNETLTQEEKKLLEIELTIRSQYGVICATKPVAPFHDLPFGGRQRINEIYFRENDSIFHFGPYQVHGVENIRPYLRRMESMTEEEEIYYNTVYTTLTFYEKEDWLNGHHFDYRGLIEKGLALEAPEWMYNKEEGSLE